MERWGGRIEKEAARRCRRRSSSGKSVAANRVAEQAFTGKRKSFDGADTLTTCSRKREIKCCTHPGCQRPRVSNGQMSLWHSNGIGHPAATLWQSFSEICAKSRGTLASSRRNECLGFGHLRKISMLLWPCLARGWWRITKRRRHSALTERYQTRR